MVLAVPISWKCLWHLISEEQLLQLFPLPLEFHHSHILSSARKKIWKPWMGDIGPHGFFTHLRHSFHTSACWPGSGLLWFSMKSCKHPAGTAPTSPVWPALFEAALPVQRLQSCCHVEDSHCSHLGMNLHSTNTCLWAVTKVQQKQTQFRGFQPFSLHPIVTLCKSQTSTKIQILLSDLATKRKSQHVVEQVPVLQYDAPQKWQLNTGVENGRVQLG